MQGSWWLSGFRDVCVWATNVVPDVERSIAAEAPSK